MNKSAVNQKHIANSSKRGKNLLLPALVAVGGSLTALPIAALELGELTVQSKLGQALRATIPVGLGANEQINNTCISLRQGSGGDGLPAISNAAISVANGVISLTGKSAIREPMLTMHVSIKCPYTANLSREYMLFLDPPGTASEAVVTATVAPAPRRQASAAPPSTRTTRKSIAPIEIGSNHRVGPGETLSEIVQNIDGREVALWPAVMMIFEANPHAFMDNDPNKLKAGSLLEIPAIVAGSSLPSTSSQTTAAADLSVDAGAAEISDQISNEISSAYSAAETVSNDSTVATAEAESSIAVESAVEDSAASALASLQPGDVIVDADNPYLAAAPSGTTETVILDEQLQTPSLGASPNGTSYALGATTDDSTPPNWLAWLAGSGVAIILALLLFGRRFRNRFGSTPIAVAAQPERRRPENDTATVAAITDLDFGIADDSPTEENLVLDADLIAGTGLEPGNDMHLAQDFGFAATTHLDMELPEEMSSGGAPETDIIPPFKMDMGSILESEVLPGEDDYDMSVIIDATQMPIPEDVTERDLKAVAIDVIDETLISGDYTVSKEVDFEVLEQDYEDEMSATQALNQEIAKAALELADHMDSGDDDHDDATSEMPLATVTELDVTAQLPISSEASSDTDETGLLPEQTAEFAMDEKTVEMPANDADVTQEIDTEGETIELKAN